jgi:hypothetical protein
MSDEEKTVSTDFLFARPSFWSGFGRLLDLWGKYDDYNTSRSVEEADMRALYSDWRITGQDVRDSWVVYHQKDAPHTTTQKGAVTFKCALCEKTISPLGERTLQTADSREQKRWKMKVHDVQTPSR